MTTANWTANIARSLELDDEAHTRYLGRGRFEVDSASGTGSYIVTLNVIDGQPVTTCTCRAGEFGRRCHHQAAALLMAGVLDAPQPEPAPVVERTMGAILSGDFRRNMADYA